MKLELSLAILICGKMWKEELLSKKRKN